MHGALGSFCCQIEPRSHGPLGASVARYGLSACHVVYKTPLDGNPSAVVICPGSLDILAALSREISEIRGKQTTSTALEKILGWNNTMGRATDHRLGADDMGWREDWTILELSEESAGGNDFYDREQLKIAVPGLSEDYQITAVRDPNFGETVFKDGARIGLTEGLVQGEDIYAFWKNSISPAPRRSEAPPQDRPTIVEGRPRAMWPIGGNAQPVDSGDSGSPVLGMGEGGDVAFLGMVVAMTADEVGFKKYGLFVPQSQPFRQLRQSTGVEWGVVLS